MLKYVKEGALDLLALTLPSSLLESIRQVSEDDFLTPPMDTILLQNDNSCHPPSVSTAIHLPYEILTVIFQFLPASDLFSVVAVNRLWRQIALLETKQIDLSECFPVDCLGLEDEPYSDFAFVFNLFSMFPLISGLVVKDRYMRDRDMRVVTAGILAGKMAFTTAAGPPVGTVAYRQAQSAVAERRRQLSGQHQQQLPESAHGNHGSDPSANSSTVPKPAKPTHKLMRGTIKEEIREFSRSVGTYALIPQTRNTLRKKILERLEYNIEHREIQQYCWMVDSGIDPATLYSSEAVSSPFTLVSSMPATSQQSSDKKRYPLVPMTHYRFQDCCFANDWGAAMDVNKLPMIGLAAAISGQGLVVDLEGSYGAPSKSIKTMLGFCFGAHCVISLDLNFRHTHMELEHVAELLSENPILNKIDIVDSPAYHELIRLPALRGLGAVLERMQCVCLDLEERSLEESVGTARLLLLDLESAVEQEEARREEKHRKATVAQESAIEDDSDTNSAVPPPFILHSRPLDDPQQPIESLSRQLVFPEGTSKVDKVRTATVLLKGVMHHGLTGLINTRDRTSGQSLLHALAWRRSYSSLVAHIRNSLQAGSSDLPTPPSHQHHFQQQYRRLESESLYSTSLPPPSMLSTSSTRFLSSSPPVSSSSWNTHHASISTIESASTEEPTPASDGTSASTTSIGLSSLISISALPAALTSALSFRRLSLPATLWIPEDSEDIGVGGGSLPTPDVDETEDDDPLVNAGIRIEALDIEEGPQDPSTNFPSQSNVSPIAQPVVTIPEQHPVAIALRMARTLLQLNANPNVFNKDGRSAVVCASFTGFQPMEALLIEHGGYSKELIRIRETM
ncbi:hypothetical protein BGZ99_006260 [Dissophora globulifera]|uniref:F-box domain-containing protein n=1 Tax=Dissophora globulifera TaxID=979702 RepID=A0A9P6UZT7_9FUNG|nr:hypothetical protein BGZ99_006260 [Dissophora globulifera]